MLWLFKRSLEPPLVRVPASFLVDQPKMVGRSSVEVDTSDVILKRAAACNYSRVEYCFG